MKRSSNRRPDSTRLLNRDPDLALRLKQLRRQYKLNFSVAFDATSDEHRGKGWLTDYAVVDITIALPSKKGEIPDDLYLEAIEIFRRAQKLLQRSKTFFLLRIVPALKKQPAWSLALLFTHRDLAASHRSIRQTSVDLLPLMLQNRELKTMYARTPHVLCAYSQRDKRVYAFPSEVLLTFSDYYRYSDEVEQSVLSDKCGDDIICASGVYLGNMNYWLQRDRETIPHWQRAGETGQPEALMCIAGSYARLGNIPKACQFAKKAIENGVPRKMLNDPDFAKLRRHPLFKKLQAVQKAKPKRPAVALSPKWSMPKNLRVLVEENDGFWQDERWFPILLTVMSGTSNRGRKISLSWQLEFDPYDKRFKSGSKQIKARGVEPDGDAWTNFIEREFAKYYPELVREFDSDPEMATCVVSVQSENACKKLLELILSLSH